MEPTNCGSHEVLAVFGESELVAFAFVLQVLDSDAELPSARDRLM